MKTKRTFKTKKTITDFHDNGGWCTIGGRIEDYAAIAKRHGLLYAKDRMRECYIDDVLELVYTGLKVFLYFGANSYYTGK